MIYRIPITKDNTISNYASISQLQKYGNAGASQLVDTWVQYRPDYNAMFLTRFLAEANLTALQSAISLGVVPNPVTDSTVTCNLKFFNITFADPVAYEYTLQVFPITQSWQEGRGTRIDSFTNTGYSNWISASNTANWIHQGGDYDSSVSGTQYFTSGSEDLSINTKQMLINWLNGSSANYGFLVKMDNIAENVTASISASNLQYYRKSFHGRLTNYPNFAPYFQLEWTSGLIQDSRQIVQFGTNSSIYFYNSPNGIYTDIDGITANFPGYITLSGAALGSSATLSAFTGNTDDTAPISANNVIATPVVTSRVKAGVYKANFVLPSSASIYNQFTDVWTITSAASAVTLNMSLFFNPSSTVSADINYTLQDFTMAIPRWSTIWNKDTIISKKVYFFEKSPKLIPLVQSETNSISSIASSTISTYVSTSGWWRVINDTMGIVDIDWQPLEYDGNSNFFTINFSNFSRSIKYRLEFKVIILGETIIFDDQNSAAPYFFSIE